MRLRSFATIATLLCISGCIAPPRGHIPPTRLFETFKPEEHAPYRESGPNRVEGQAFLRQRGGTVVTCAGAKVVVAPATDFIREVLAFIRAGGDLASLPIPGREYQSILRQTTCDAQGNFAIANLPAGRWIVATGVEWTVGRERQGGTVQREIVLPSSERILLTDDDHSGPALLTR